MSNLIENKEAFGFVLKPGFPFMAVSSAVDVLALANYVSKQKLYSWYSLSESTRPVQGMNGFSITPDFTFENAPEISTAVVCAGIRGKDQTSAGLSSWLRWLFANGSQVGAISTGSWVLAEAGLLEKRRCTIHWEDMPAFQEMYPDHNVSCEIFEVDGRIFTCSGGTAVVDLFLSFVMSRHGIDLTNEIAQQLVHQQRHTTNLMQRERLSTRLGINHKNVSNALSLMEKHIETPISISKISHKIGLSERHLERLFRNLLGCAPQEFYMTLRLQQAQSLILGTSLPIFEIAFATGFTTSSYFAKCYKHHYGYSPSKERRQTGNRRFAQGDS